MARQNCSRQASPEHFQQCAKFLPLRNRGLGTLAVTFRAPSLPPLLSMTYCAPVKICDIPRFSTVTLLIGLRSPLDAGSESV